MARPTRYSAPVSVRIPRPLVRDLDKLAKKFDMPRSRLILEAIELFVADPPRVRPRKTLAEEVAEREGVFD